MAATDTEKREIFSLASVCDALFSDCYVDPEPPATGIPFGDNETAQEPLKADSALPGHGRGSKAMSKPDHHDKYEPVCQGKLEPSSNVAETRLRAELQHERFTLCASYLGIFARYNASLDKRLENSNEIKSLVLQLLKLLRMNLDFVISKNTIQPEPETTELPDTERIPKLEGTSSEALDAVESTIDRLHKLGLTIRRYPTSSLDNRIRAFTERHGDEHYSELSRQIVHYKYRVAPPSLKDQLAQSMVARRQRLEYIRRHQGKLARRPSAAESDSGEFLKANPHVPPAFRRKDEPITGIAGVGSYGDDAELKRAQRPVSEEAPLKQTMNPSVTFASSFRPTQSVVARIREGDGKTVVSSSKRSTTPMAEDLAGYPEPPEQKREHLDPICPFCCLPLQKHQLNVGSWKRHVNLDLRPFVCISESCSKAPQAFETVEVWARHMRDLHSSAWPQLVHKPIFWRCDVDHPDIFTCTDEDVFERHLESHHGNCSMETLKAISRTSRISRRRPSNICPLCGYDVSVSDSTDILPNSTKPDNFGGLEILVNHISGHLLGLAFDSSNHLNAGLGYDDSLESLDISNGKEQAESKVHHPSGQQDISTTTTITFADDEVDRPTNWKVFNEFDKEWTSDDFEFLCSPPIELSPTHVIDWDEVKGVLRESVDPKILEKIDMDNTKTTPDHIIQHIAKCQPLVRGPSHAYTESKPQNAFTNSIRLMSEIAETLGGSSLQRYPQSTINRLYREAAELACFKYPQARTFGFVGDSGVGKSSLINSLLDIQGLARTSNSGETCTCAVTEYYYHNLNTFEVQVKYFTIDEIIDQLTEMLQSYRHFHFHYDDMNGEARQEFEARANLARDTFHAMFRGRLDDDGFLLNGKEDAVLDILIRWAESEHSSMLPTRHPGLSLQECSDILMRLSSEPQPKVLPSVWPYISGIKVYSNASILSTGLILVDLPGLRDLNSARKLITERYLLKCNEIFAICNISRAVTDAGVNYVIDLALQARLSDISIICTRSEDIEAEEATKDWGGIKGEFIKQLADTIAADDYDIRRIQKKIDEHVDDIELDARLTLDGGDAQKDWINLWKELKSIRSRREDHVFQLKEYLVKSRNAIVIRQLKAQYGQNIGVDERRIFCVSSKDYWFHREKPKHTSRQFLSLSGIPETREYCLSTIKRSQRRAEMGYMNDCIPSLLAQVELWTRSRARNASGERLSIICYTLNEIEAKLKKDLSSLASFSSSILESTRKDFMENIYEANKMRGKDDLFRCGTDPHNPLRPRGSRNYGNHFTRSTGDRNWNKEIISSMVGDLKHPWQQFCRSLRQRWAQLTDFVERVTSAVVDRLKNELDELSDATIPLPPAILAQKRLFIDALRRAYEQLEKDIELLRIDAFSGIRSSSIGQYMEPSYRRCSQECGQGSDARRKRIIQAAVANKKLFTDLMAVLKRGLLKQVDKAEKLIKEAAAGYLKATQDVFNIIRSETIIQESEEDREFRNRISEATQAWWDELRKNQAVAVA